MTNLPRPEIHYGSPIHTCGPSVQLGRLIRSLTHTDPDGRVFYFRYLPEVVDGETITRAYDRQLYGLNSSRERQIFNFLLDFYRKLDKSHATKP